MAAVEDKGKEAKRQRRCDSLRKFVWAQILAISLVIGIGIGLAWPVPGVLFATKVKSYSPLQMTLVIIIFLVMGLKLNTADAKRAIRQYKGLAWGIIVILFVTGAIAASLTGVVSWPDGFNTFGIGLVIFFVGPTTSSSGVVMVQSAHGNWTLSLLLTVFTSILAIFTIPPMLLWLATFETSDVSLLPSHFRIHLAGQCWPAPASPCLKIVVSHSTVPLQARV